MKKLTLILLVLIMVLSVTACSRKTEGDGGPAGSTGGGYSNVDEDTFNPNKDINVSKERLGIGDKELPFGDFSIKWMLDNGFVLTSDADYSEEHEMRAYGTESFSFIQADSEDDMNAVLITLTYMNQADSAKPFRTAKLTEVYVELGDESMGKTFTDVVIKAPFGIASGVGLDAVKSVLGEPSTSKFTERYHYTTYEWFVGTRDYVQVRIGDTMGLVNFTIIMN